jgi:long-chain acyl-CoA synthetase
VTASPPDPTTLNELFFSSLDRFGARPVLLRWKQDGTWREMSYQELLSRVQALSLGLADLGVQPGDRVAIISENRPEWAITDYACLTARCADVPIYPTLPAKQVEYILRDSNSVAVFASSRELLEKAQAGRARLPALRHVIAFDAALAGGDVLSFDSVLERGRRLDGRAAAWRAEALRVVPDDLATQIYTSGTTGEPKGVMLTHRNITTNVVAGIRILPLTPDDECLSFLPLSHIFERMAGHYCMMLAGTLINYASSIDAVAAEMLERRPTVVLSVPRLFEKIYARVLEGATSGSALKRAIFTWARRKGERWVDLTLAGRPVPPLLAMQHRVAHALVFSKLHARVGGRLRFFVSGGAPLSPEIAKFFFAAGLPILEGYGLTDPTVRPEAYGAKNHLPLLLPSVDARNYRPTRNNWGPLVVPAGHYWLMGDNRDQSLDSRFMGPIPRRTIRGKPLFIYYSFDKQAGAPFPAFITAARWKRIGTPIH